MQLLHKNTNHKDNPATPTPSCTHPCPNLKYTKPISTHWPTHHASWWKSIPIGVNHHPQHNVWAHMCQDIGGTVCVWACANMHCSVAPTDYRSNKNPFKKGCVWSRGMFRYQWDGLRNLYSPGKWLRGVTLQWSRGSLWTLKNILLL